MLYNMFCDFLIIVVVVFAAALVFSLLKDFVGAVFNFLVENWWLFAIAAGIVLFCYSGKILKFLKEALG